MQHPVSSQHSLNSNHLIQQQDKLNSSGITNADSYMSNNFQANDQVDKLTQLCFQIILILIYYPLVNYGCVLWISALQS